MFRKHTNPYFHENRQSGCRLSALLSALLSVLFLISSVPAPVFAAVKVQEGGVAMASAGTFSTSDDADSEYLDPVNTFSDGPVSYYLVTQEAAKSSLTSVDYQGNTYPLTAVVVSSNLNDMKVNGVSIFAVDHTIFFDSGVYNDSEASEYTRLSVTNLSLVGLYEDANGDPTASLTKKARADNTVERYNIMHKNVYFENLIFDGLGRNMTSAKNRGEYCFFITGAAAPWDNTDGFVMKNCVIQNVGASNMASTSKSVAINIYSSNGRHNFEGLVIRNIKTTFGLGIVSMNRATQNYFKDLTIDGSLASSTSNSIKIEDTDSGIDVPYLTYKNVFAGALTLTKTGGQGYVYIERYQYAGTYVPQEYRYARYSTSNGSSFSSAINVYSSLPAASSSYAVLDLTDNYWIVRTDSATSVENQITAIRTVLSRVSSAGVPNSIPGYKIKLVTAVSSIGSFAVPDLGSAPASLVAVKLLETGNPAAYDSTELIPFTAASTITLKSSDPSGILIYNIDFDSQAFYTMKEAVSGVALITPADPNESAPPAGYPVYGGYALASSAKVAGSRPATFVNCAFTALASTVTINNPISELGLTQQTTFDADITGGYTDSSMAASASSVNDTSIRWFSSNPAVLSIDPLTGVATAHALGTATITAKSTDSLNQGEIEKPFASFAVTVRDLFYVSYNANGSDSGTAPAQVPVISGKTTIIMPENDLIRAGYTFEGWNVKPDGTGTN